MTRTMSRSQREEAFVEKARELFYELEEWYDQHPEATFGELELKARQSRRKMMGKGLELLVNGRDTGQQAQRPTCSECEQPMSFKGHRPKWVQGLEGESQLERAYYVCPDCNGETIFPPRCKTKAKDRPLE